MKLTVHTPTWTLKKPFRISRGSYSSRKAIIVELEQAGYSGFGEASEHEYYGVTQDILASKCHEIRPIVENSSWRSPEELWFLLYPPLKGHPFVLCALDNAAHDLYGKMHGRSFAEIHALPLEPRIKSSWTIGLDTLDIMTEEVVKSNFDILKIKLGMDNDLEVLRAIRSVTDATIRVDINTAWTVQETIERSFTLQDLGVEFIEQPLKADNRRGMAEVFRKSALPIIADESCRSEKDVSGCAGLFQGINIKLMKCGGLTPALRMIEHARQLGLKIMAGCMVESSVGISALAQLSPVIDYIDMDGSMFLLNDPARGAKLASDGTIQMPAGNGLGIEPV